VSIPGFAIRAARSDEFHAILAVDDAASTLYLQAGLDLGFTPDHPFVVAESERWARAIDAGRAAVAVGDDGRLLGFMTLDIVDGAPYLDQLAVHPQAMRRGIGNALLRRAFARSGDRPLWLTTYAHLPWNRPWYERHGFTPVAEEHCGPEMRGILASQRAVLPAPEQRVALVRQRFSSTT
jgi:ribosomal protein S18 acetylase RimI-like enzyme